MIGMVLKRGHRISFGHVVPFKIFTVGILASSSELTGYIKYLRRLSSICCVHLVSNFSEEKAFEKSRMNAYGIM